MNSLLLLMMYCFCDFNSNKHVGDLESSTCLKKELEGTVFQ